MKAPLIARILGIALFIGGVVGFVPFATVPAGLTDQYVTLGANYGFLATLFPVNLVHDVVHLVFGIWGIAASWSFAASVSYCRWLAWIYGILTILGVIPLTNTLFGIAPIYGYDVLLHAIVAIAALYGGYGAARIPPPPDPAVSP
jgi:hypothetical protein